ncbi:MAG: CocE/NonD family hydrolase [Bacteroidota bacterium]
MRKIYLFLLIFFAFSFVNLNAKYYPIRIETRVSDTAKKYLNADVYSIDTTVPKPVILIQTPYNKDNYRIMNQLPSMSGAANHMTDTVNYNYVVLDWRGFYSNKNQDISSYDRGLDGYDAIEWIALQNWCNGKLGTIGASALGVIQYQTARRQPPHLVCCVPLVKDYKSKYEDYFYGGDYRKEHVEALQNLGFFPTSLVTSHPTYDIVWKTLENNSDYPEDIQVPVFIISGWFDHFPDAVLRSFNDLKEKSGANVRFKHKLMFGPWLHSDVGLLKQGELEFPSAKDSSSVAAQRFFDFYIRNIQNGWDNEPTVKYFEMGTNQWKTANDWKNLPRTSDSLFLDKNGILGFAQPDFINDSAQVLFDPKNPSPSIGGSRFNPFDRSTPDGPRDIKDTIENRNDVLIWTSPVLESDLNINGKTVINLYISSDRKDTDFGVRLTDVYPDGRSMIITQGIKRMRFRNSYSDEELLTPYRIYPVSIELESLSQVFLTGHRLRIDITDSDYPMFDINLNNGGELYKPGDTLTATNTVYFGSQYPSAVVFQTPAVNDVTDNNLNSNNSFKIKLFPVPVDNELTIEINSLIESNGKIIITDILGNAVQSTDKISLYKGNNYVHTNLKDVQSGIYFAICNFKGDIQITKIQVIH